MGTPKRSALEVIDSARQYVKIGHPNGEYQSIGVKADPVKSTRARSTIRATSRVNMMNKTTVEPFINEFVNKFGKTGEDEGNNRGGTKSVKK